MLYKKIKIWGFLPWFKKLTIPESIAHINTLEVLEAFARKAKHKNLWCGGGENVK